MKFSYRVKNTEIIVSSRPRSLSLNAAGALVEGKPDPTEEADAYLSVTDTFCTPPRNGAPFVWLPWNEGRKPYPELYYASNKTLIWWVNNEERKRILIFCDGGTHRSVTVFGIFLLTYFRKDAVKIETEGKDLLREGARRQGPLEYAERYLNEFPADRLLLAAMNQDWLGRLDSHSRGIYTLVKERYGDQK